MLIRRTLVLLALAFAACLPSAVLAQDMDRYRLQDELDMTDRRIEVASSLVAENPNPVAQAELTSARDIQARARSAYAANQPTLALSGTRAARSHADRAISIVRGLPDPERVQAQVERTRDILDRARERIDGCDDTRARALVRVATDMQSRAERAAGESHYLGALQLTMSARERVLRALRLCNMEESLADAAARALQRTDEMLGRAREAVGASPAPPVRDLLARAESVQAQAHAEARLERYESAVRLTQTARTLLRRAMSFGSTGGKSPH